MQVLEKVNDVTWQIAEVKPLTNEARMVVTDQKKGTLCKVTCDEDPNEENSSGKTLVTTIGAGTVYDSEEDMFTKDAP